MTLVLNDFFAGDLPETRNRGGRRNSRFGYAVFKWINGVHLMMRVMGLVGATFVASQLVCGGALAATTQEPVRWHAAHKRIVEPAGVVTALREVAASPPSGAPVGNSPVGNSPVGNSIKPTGATVATPDGAQRKAPGDEAIEPAEQAVAWHPRHSHHARKVAVAKRGVVKPAAEEQEQIEPPAGHLPELSPDILSPQQLRVRNIALMNGDRKFLMVDKGMGKIFLFEDGKPVLMGNALTGESFADRLPPKELSERMDALNALDTKVTPAGRFTVTRGYDKDYGPLFDINQIKGKDWGIAIHQVYLGIPSENRAARLQSPREDDKNITFGCINVAPDTIHLLLRVLPEHEPTVLYVLPRDEKQTVAFFASHNS